MRPTRGQILIGDSSSVPIEGRGDMQLIPDGRGGTHTSEVLYVSGLGYHLLSVHKICSLGLLVEFDSDAVRVLDRGSRKLLTTGYEENAIYKMKSSPAFASLLLSSQTETELWHARFGHLNYEYLRKASKGEFVRGLPDIGVSHSPCVSCIKGKQHRDAIPKKASRRSTSPLEMVSTDLCVYLCGRSL